jgi:hypothetical protein
VTVTTWRYYLPNDERLEGWAIVFLDSTGCFTTVSDWGNYGYRWDNPGSSVNLDVREWLIARGDDYLLSKLAPEEIYDGPATRKGVEDYLAKQLLEHRATPSWAEDERAALQEYEIQNGVEEFWRWVGGTSLVDAHECMRTQPRPQAVQFIKRVMPRLRNLIREELRTETERAMFAAGVGST